MEGMVKMVVIHAHDVMMRRLVIGEGDDNENVMNKRIMELVDKFVFSLPSFLFLFMLCKPSMFNVFFIFNINYILKQNYN